MESWELLRQLRVARPEDPRWRDLFERCRELIRIALRSRFAGRCRISIGVLDDLAQDVMERLVADRRKVIHRFTGRREAAFEVYIRRIAENILRDQFRREGKRRHRELMFPADEPWRLEAVMAESPAANATHDPESAVIMRELNERVAEVLRRISLDDRQRALNRLLFQLYFVDHHSVPQIARLRAVPLSASSVARRIRLIKHELRKSFATERDRVEIQRRESPVVEPRRRRRNRERSR
jgi:RNA polymerase sigma factor (sigma-70 family)